MDIRLIKTEKALDNAMTALLSRRNFQKITASEICAEALVSRASFYAHYMDKYDFLQSWIPRVLSQKLTFREPYEYIEKTINDLFFENKNIITNIVKNADKETLALLRDLVVKFLDFTTENTRKSDDPKSIIYQNIFAGGIIHHISWLVDNDFQGDILPMNTHLYDIIAKWDEM